MLDAVINLSPPCCDSDCLDVMGCDASEFRIQNRCQYQLCKTGRKGATTRYRKDESRGNLRFLPNVVFRGSLKWVLCEWVNGEWFKGPAALLLCTPVCPSFRRAGAESSVISSIQTATHTRTPTISASSLYRAHLI
jgi:hypothetical protein